MLLKELKLQASNPSSLYYFYKDLLELPTVYSDENSINIKAGTSSLTFEKAKEKVNPFYHFAFNIPSNKFEEAFLWMKKKVALLWLDDYQSEVADFINWNAKSFYFLDPEGNILEIIARHDLNDHEKENFSSSQIRNISEIGLVLPAQAFDEEVHTLMNKYPLSYFEKQKPLPFFRAIGDNVGLFIVVPEGRIWFSTKNKMATLFPMEVRFMEGNEFFSYTLK